MRKTQGFPFEVCHTPMLKELECRSGYKLSRSFWRSEGQADTSFQAVCHRALWSICMFAWVFLSRGVSRTLTSSSDHWTWYSHRDSELSWDTPPKWTCHQLSSSVASWHILWHRGSFWRTDLSYSTVECPSSALAKLPTGPCHTSIIDQSASSANHASSSSNSLFYRLRSHHLCHAFRSALPSKAGYSGLSPVSAESRTPLEGIQS